MAIMSRFCVLFSVLVLCGCTANSPALITEKQNENQNGIGLDQYKIEPINSQTLQSWWGFFDDAVLNDFISSALNLNQVQPRSEVLGEDGKKSTFKTLLSDAQDQKADLINEVTQGYLKFRYIQNQHILLDQYLSERKAIYGDNIRDIKSDAQQFSASVKEIETLEKQEKKYALQQKNIVMTLARHTKLLPEYIDERLKHEKPLPTVNIAPILASNASVLENTKEIAVAKAFYGENGLIFSGQTVGQLYGIPDEALVNNNLRWRVKPGQAVRLLNLPDADKFQDYRKQVLEKILEVEQSLTAYAHLKQQKTLLQNSADDAQQKHDSLKQFVISSPAAVKSAQDDLNKSQLATLKANYEMSKILIELYHLLGVY